MADKEPLIVDGGAELDHIDDNYFTYIDKSICLYGPSKCGKTTMIKHILHKLKDYIPTVLLICPSEQSNNDYKGIIPRAALYPDITEKQLITIWERQEAAAQTASSSENTKILERLYLKCSHSRTDKILLQLDEYFDKAKRDLKKRNLTDAQYETELEEIKKKYDDVLRNIYKKQIAANKDKFDESKLTKEEEITLSYINFSPRLLIIMDDFTARLRKLSNTEVMKNFLFRGRHGKITFMIVSHSANELVPSIRQSVMISVFGSAEIANGFFERSAGNGFTTQQYREIKKMIDPVFKEKHKSPEKYRKFVWMRLAMSYCYFLADVVKTELFGSDAFIELCRRGEKDQTSLDTNNSFFNTFHNI
jgi:energy-coupling factor transporter ATP-binding protein EcfA2